MTTKGTEQQQKETVQRQKQPVQQAQKSPLVGACGGEFGFCDAVEFADVGVEVDEARTDGAGVQMREAVGEGVGGLEAVAGDAGDSDLVGPMRPVAYRRAVTAVVTPPAVSVKMPSVSASSWMPETISTSETSSAQPPVSRIILAAAGPSAGLPMARERAMVLGRCGSMKSVPCLTATEMGEQPVAWAPKKRTGFSSTRPR